MSDHLTKEEKSKAGKRALIHFFLAAAWGPLAWVITGDLLIQYIGQVRYFEQIQWGVASSGVMYNSYRLLIEILRAAD